MKNKIELDFVTICNRINKVALPTVDMIVGIANGGIVPSSLLAYRMGCSLKLIQINYRAVDNSPQRLAPEVMQTFHLPAGVKRILLVDDVSVTGQTIETARKILKDYDVISFVLKGKADYVVFPEITECVIWPWKIA